MLRLKPKTDTTSASSSAATTGGEPAGSAASATSAAASTTGGFSLTGVGGKSVKADGIGKAGKQQTPGELRVFKG